MSLANDIQATPRLAHDPRAATCGSCIARACASDAAHRRGAIGQSAHRALRRSRAAVSRVSTDLARTRCAASNSAARPKAGRCSRWSRPRTAFSTRTRLIVRSGRSCSCRAASMPASRRQGRRLAGAARDARWHAAPGALAAATFVFVPVLNVDGHERFGRWNRPNQVGPEEMGWRTTAQNFNLNRDYVKADAPEMQAVLRLMNAVGSDPVRRPARHRRRAVRARRLRTTSRRRMPAIADLRRSARRAARRAACSACAMPARCRSTSIRRSRATTTRPRASPSASGRSASRTEYWARAQPHRRARRDALLEGLPDARAHHAQLDHRDDGDGRARRPQWLQAAKTADEHSARAGGTSVALSYENTPHVRTIEFRGYEYTREPSADLGRAADALRPEEAADLAHSAAR